MMGVSIVRRDCSEQEKQAEQTSKDGFPVVLVLVFGPSVKRPENTFCQLPVNPRDTCEFVDTGFAYTLETTKMGQ